MMTNQVETDINDINTEIMGMIHSLATGDSLPFQHCFTHTQAVCRCFGHKSQTAAKKQQLRVYRIGDLTNEMYLSVWTHYTRWKSKKKRNLQSAKEPRAKKSATKSMNHPPVVVWCRWCDCLLTFCFDVKGSRENEFDTKTRLDRRTWTA